MILPKIFFLTETYGDRIIRKRNKRIERFIQLTLINGIKSMDIAYSRNGVPIRLNYERWYHITENHDDMASYYYDVLEAVENPNLIIRGNKGTLKAARNLGKNKWLVVIYREVSKKDGFIITAYFLDKRPKGEIIWQQS